MRFIPDRFQLATDRKLTLANLHSRVAELRGDRVFLKLHEPLDYTNFPTNNLTYNDTAAFVERMASALLDMGIKPGERVGISTQNNADLPLGIFSIIRAGAIAVPMNYMLKGKEMRYIMENSDAETLIVDSEVFSINIRDRERIPGIKRWIMTGGSRDIPDGFLSLDQAMQAASPQGPDFKQKVDDVCAIFYTSGTTGFPKGATMTSGNLLTAQKIGATLLPVKGGDPGLFCLPASHVMGFGAYIMGTCVGLKAYYMRHFSPREVLEAMEHERIQVFVGVPAMYAMMLDEGIDKYDLSSLKMLGSAADAMPTQQVEEFRRKGSLFRLGPIRPKAFFVEIYGMVELAGLATMKVAIMGVEYPQGCVGWPVWPVRMRILDEYGKKLPRGEVGEVSVYGPGVCQGYWNNPAATEELIENGWLRTGDMGLLDKWGRLNFVDRKKDVIKCGGYSIFSVEVEREVLEHPAVEAVAVVGVPHPLKKQMPIAVVSLATGAEATEEEIQEWCKQNIGAYKCPRAIRIVRPEEMPYGMTLKVRKLELRDRFSDLFMGEKDLAND
jgi:long-chain acyl-CoA synthetase